MDQIEALLAQLGLEGVLGDGGTGGEDAPPPPAALTSFDLDGLAAKIETATNIIVMAGAGKIRPVSRASL